MAEQSAAHKTNRHHETHSIPAIARRHDTTRDPEARDNEQARLRCTGLHERKRESLIAFALPSRHWGPHPNRNHVRYVHAVSFLGASSPAPHSTAEHCTAPPASRNFRHSVSQHESSQQSVRQLQPSIELTAPLSGAECDSNRAASAISCRVQHWKLLPSSTIPLSPDRASDPSFLEKAHRSLRAEGAAARGNKKWNGRNEQRTSNFELRTSNIEFCRARP